MSKTSCHNFFNDKATRTSCLALKPVHVVLAVGASAQLYSVFYFEVKDSQVNGPEHCWPWCTNLFRLRSQNCSLVLVSKLNYVCILNIYVLLYFIISLILFSDSWCRVALMDSSMYSYQQIRTMDYDMDKEDNFKYIFVTFYIRYRWYMKYTI